MVHLCRTPCGQYICATGEHGTPAEPAAKEAGLSVAEFCAQAHDAQKAVYDGFELAFDSFGRSSSQQLLLVTIDGRDPMLSVGVTLPEAAKVMKWLGATDAVGLGSGGDTTLIANDTLYNRPVDDWGGTLRERAVSNAVVIIKKP